MKMILRFQKLGRQVLVTAPVDTKSQEHQRTDSFPYSLAGVFIRVQSSVSVIATQFPDLLLDVR